MTEYGLRAPAHLRCAPARRLPALVGLLALVIGASVPAAAQVPRVTNTGEFWHAFSDAVKSGKLEPQKELIRVHYPDLAIGGFFVGEAEWCALSQKEEQAAAAQVRAEVLNQIGLVVKLDKRVDFLLMRWGWLQQLKPEQKEKKVRMWDLICDGYPKYEEVQKSRSAEAARSLMAIYSQVVQLATEATDWYWAAEGYFYLGKLAEVIGDNWLEAVYFYKKAIEVGLQGHSAGEIAKQNIEASLSVAAKQGRIKHDLVDINLPFEEAKTKYQAAIDALNAPGGAGGAPPGKDDKGKPPANGGEAPPAGVKSLPPGARPNVHTSPIEWEDVRDFKIAAQPPELPFYAPLFPVNAHWTFWPQVIIDRDKTVKAPMLQGAAEIQNDGGKVFLMPEGKDKTKTPIRLKLGAKPELTEIADAHYPDGTKGKVWHTMMAIPSQYSFNGFQFNTGESSLYLKYRGSTMAKGKVRGQDFVIYDLDGNGAFNDFGRDCIVVGSGKAAKLQPLSKYVMIDELFYELKVEPNGRTVRSKPYDGPVAPLKFEFAGNTKPQSMVGAGTGDDQNYYFELMEGIDHPIWVIPGQLRFSEGFMIKDKGDKAKTVWIQFGRSTTINVQANIDNVWKMGGAGEKGYHFVFKVNVEKEKGQDVIKLPPKEIKICGSFGEYYENSMFGPPLPTIQVRKGKDGPVAITEKTKKPEQGDIREGGFDAMWYPKPVEIKKTFAGEFSVKLEADYPPLGKITSEWLTVE